MIVKEIMSPMLETVGPEMPIPELGRFLADRRISGAPVLEDGHLVGVVSIRDLSAEVSSGALKQPRDRPSRPHYFQDLWMEDDQSLNLGAGLTARVRDIMTPVVYSIEESARVEELVELMLRSRIHRVVVKARGGPIGIVTTTDLVALVPRLLQQ